MMKRIARLAVAFARDLYWTVARLTCRHADQRLARCPNRLYLWCPDCHRQTGGITTERRLRDIR